eukprot:6131416-Pyramimonas_sp.AAC.1
MASYTPSREWEWAREPFQHADLGMPSLEEGTLEFRDSPQFATIGGCPQEGKYKTNQQHVTLRTVQFNAKSMCCRASKGTRGRRRLMRTQILKTQFAAEHLHLIGVQESRNPERVCACRGPSSS